MFVPAKLAADAVIECIEAEVPLIVAYAEGVPTQDQLRVNLSVLRWMLGLISQIQSVLRSQGKSRLIGANCPGMIIPHAKVKLGIQPLAVHSPGCVGRFYAPHPPQVKLMSRSRISVRYHLLRARRPNNRPRPRPIDRVRSRR